MSIFYSKLVSLILAPFIFTASLFASAPAKAPDLGATLPQGPAVFETSLLSAITSSATSMTLVANSVRGGNSLSGTQCFTVDEGRAEREDICGTVSGTAVSSLVRGIDPLTATTTNALLQFAHRRGAQVKITDFPLIQVMRNQLKGTESLENPLFYASQIGLSTASSTSVQIPYVSWVFNNFVSLYDNQTIGGSKTYTGLNTFTTANRPKLTSDTDTGTNEDLVTFGQLSRVSLAGTVDASYTTKGIAERATVAEINSGATSGGTSAPLFISPSDLIYSSFASTTASTTQIVGINQLSTTTRLMTGETIVVTAAYTVEDTGITGLYLKPTGLATSTLQGTGQNSSGGAVPTSRTGSYVAIQDGLVQIYIGNGGPNAIYSQPAGTGSFTILKFGK